MTVHGFPLENNVPGLIYVHRKYYTILRRDNTVYIFIVDTLSEPIRNLYFI